MEIMSEESFKSSCGIQPELGMEVHWCGFVRERERERERGRKGGERERGGREREGECERERQRQMREI